MPFAIVEGDIAKMDTDAVVNAANGQLLAGGGVCGAIFAGAGRTQMERACRAIGRCPTGQAVVTPGFNLPARYVIHAVGPVWSGGSHGEESLLRGAYRSALERAMEIGASSVSFPLISAGIYGYPQDRAQAVATSEIRAFLNEHEDLSVFLVLHDRALMSQTIARYRQIAALVENTMQQTDQSEAEGRSGSSVGFFDSEADLLADASMPPATGAAAPCAAAAAAPCAMAADAAEAVGAAPRRDGAKKPVRPAGRPRKASSSPAGAAPAPSASPEARRHAAATDDLSWQLSHLDASFSATVLSLIDERGLTDVEVYKRANLSRQVFSKLRKDNGYRPTKQTAVALAVALELDRQQTDALLQRAGYALSRANKFDIIVAYFIDEGCYDIFELNEVLFAFDQPLLGSM